MEITFINITEKEFLKTKFLHKYMPLEYAIKTLNESKLWFANPAEWKDPFEKRFIEAEYLKNDKKYKFLWKDKVFCICMTQTSTSEAYWNTYSSQQIGVEFKISKQKLLDELLNYTNEYDIYIGKVEYMKTADIQKSISKIPFKQSIGSINIEDKLLAAKLLLLKRNAYKYEDEIRIIIVKKVTSKERGISLNYTCDNNKLIDSIVLDPSLPENSEKLFKNIFENEYDFKPRSTSKGIRKRVLKSQLYSKQKPQVISI